MRKNNMRIPEEKEHIINELLDGKTSWRLLLYMD